MKNKTFYPLLAAVVLASAITFVFLSRSMATTPKESAVTSAPQSKTAPTPAVTAPTAPVAPPTVVVRPEFVDSLRENFPVGLCCNAPLGRCAIEKPNCSAAPRLMSFLQWMDSTKQIPEERIAEMLDSRHTTLTDKTRYTSDLKGWPVIGDPRAPFTVVMYYSGTCPLCKTNFTDLHMVLTTGRLRGKVNIVAKPFGAAPVNRALVAAHEMGRFSDFMIELGKIKGRIEEQHVMGIADGMYLDRQRFQELMESKEVEKRIEEATEEGRRNGVTHIPTYFMGGRRYNSSLFPRWIVDAIEFLMETDPAAGSKK